MPTPPAARLHLPAPALGDCVHLAVERDTRGAVLTDAQRFNHYPATPLPMLSWIFDGELHMVAEPAPGAAPSDMAAMAAGVPLSPALSRLVLSGPRRAPSASWSPGPVHALSVAFYPHALSRLLGVDLAPLQDRIVPLESLVGGALRDRLLGGLHADGCASFARVDAVLRSLWQGVQGRRALPTMRGWVQSVAVRAAFSKPGASLRQVQRRFRDWTGHSQRELQLYVRTERAMAQAMAQGEAPDLAAVAADAGFADQSHMGREVRRVTGHPPGRLGELMKAEESFWFYRLLADHLRDSADPRVAAPGAQAMCSTSSGATTQRCLRSSTTDTVGPGKDGSANAPTGTATKPSSPSAV